MGFSLLTVPYLRGKITFIAARLSTFFLPVIKVIAIKCLSVLTIPYFRLKEPPAFLNIDIYAVLALTPWAALQKKKYFYLCYQA